MEGGTWGIVIIISAFMIQFLAFGVTATIGVYNIELLEYFNGNTIGVSLIASLNCGIFLGSGPIVSYLMTKFSYRKIAIFGSALVVIGLIGTSMLPYIATMCICFGLLTGFGSCCAYIPSHVLSGLYYEKNRSLATGIATSGSGLGGAIMPVIAGLLIDSYSWRGSLIVVAGLCLHMFIFSSLLLMPKNDPTAAENKQQESKLLSPGDSESEDINNIDPPHSNKQLESAVPETPLNSSSKKQQVEDLEIVNPNKEESKALISKKHLEKQNGGLKNHILPPLKTAPHHKSLGFKIPNGSGSTGVTASLQDLSNRDHVNIFFSTSDTEHTKEHHNGELLKSNFNKTKGPSAQHSWRLSSSLTSLHAVGSTRGSSYLYFGNAGEGGCAISQRSVSIGGVSRNGAEMQNGNFAPSKSTSNGELLLEGKGKSDKGPRSSRHVYIFTHYGFDIYFLSNIMWNAGCSMVSSFAPEYLRSQGLTAMEAAWLLGAFGFGCFLGGVFGGIMGNVTWINRQATYTVANVVMGATLIVFPYMDSRNMYMACLLVSGLAFGVILGLLIVVLTDLIGIESLGNGLGYLMLSNGMGTFIGPPLAGALKEATGGFESGIILAGGLCIGGGVVMLLMPCKSLVIRLCGCPASTRSKRNLAPHNQGGSIVAADDV